jgi:uncharacterized protein (TIGR02246 family)
MSPHLIVRAAALSLCWVLLTAASPPVQKSEGRAEDRAQIARLLADWETAWNTHDMRRLAALFREDAVWVLWTGEVWTGRARFEAGMAEVHKIVYQNSIQREQLEELTFVGPDAAVLRFRSELAGDSRYPDRTVRSRKILLLTRSDGVWRIGWGQNTRFIADMETRPSPARP